MTLFEFQLQGYVVPFPGNEILLTEGNRSGHLFSASYINYEIQNFFPFCFNGIPAGDNGSGINVKKPTRLPPL